MWAIFKNGTKRPQFDTRLSNFNTNEVRKIATKQITKTLEFDVQI